MGNADAAIQEQATRRGKRAIVAGTLRRQASAEEDRVLHDTAAPVLGPLPLGTRVVDE